MQKEGRQAPVQPVMPGGVTGKGKEGKTEKGSPADQREAFLAGEKVKTGFYWIQSVNK